MLGWEIQEQESYEIWTHIFREELKVLINKNQENARVETEGKKGTNLSLSVSAQRRPHIYREYEWHPVRVLGF